ncbi:MAG TPA: cytochrome d ubiquinol oxidase subunit II [Casimicrobiaceae bacterium]|jgi:cytochrome d ubiquinol oxidase subunit II|nr:cytochrome d ubiquinol oxidase subunit II [Casimicrobiaceae bacterium]
MEPLDLVPVWTVILAASVFMYVLLDGFDLGVGILFAFIRDDHERTLMMNSVAPIWDGNETWLIMGGMGMLAAFPLAFAIIIPAVYFPILLMLLGLIFRGVAFEFRLKKSSQQHWWDASFFGGSAIATFFQGVVLGMYVEGFTVSGRVFSGTSFDWFGPFPLLTGVGLLFGYTLLGATWLVMKTEGRLQQHARNLALVALYGVLAFIAMVSVWTPLMHGEIAQRWFSTPNIFYLALVPIVTAIIAFVTWRALRRDSDYVPFIGAMGLFVMCYLGLGISLFPYIVPYAVTLWDAAATPSTQMFLLIGTLFLLPIIFTYLGWSYYVFRGKVSAEVGYH